MLFYKRGQLSKNVLELAKMASYDMLMAIKAASLPVEFDALTLTQSHIYILPIQYFVQASRLSENHFDFLGSGGTMYLEESGKYCILYDESETEENQRWTLAVLISYIKLGFLDPYPYQYMTLNSIELQNEEFAYQLTCPDIILRECGILEGDRIFSACKIPLKNALAKSKHLRLRKESSLFSSVETIIKNNFKKFIDNYDRN